VSLTEALARLARHRPLLIGVDFDGTLAPITDRPHQARPNRRAMAALETLARAPEVTVAIVSGRASRDLAGLVGGPAGVTLIGEHGNDMGGELVAHDGVDVLESRLRQLAESIPGSEVEVKQSSVALHYRNAEGDLEDHLARVLELAEEWPEVKVLSGKMVVEMSLSSRTKGDAISELANGVARILYVGDDTTDETVFQVLGPDDVGIKVGEGDTAAVYRVGVVDEVAELLSFLAREVEPGSETGGEQA